MNTYPKFVSNVSIFLPSDFSARFRGWQECQKRLKILAYLPLKNPKSPTRFHQDPGFLVPRGASFWHFCSHFCDSHEMINVNPGVSNIFESQSAFGSSIVSQMYCFATNPEALYGFGKV